MRNPGLQNELLGSKKKLTNSWKGQSVRKSSTVFMNCSDVIIVFMTSSANQLTVCVCACVRLNFKQLVPSFSAPGGFRRWRVLLLRLIPPANERGVAVPASSSKDCYHGDQDPVPLQLTQRGACLNVSVCLCVWERDEVHHFYSICTFLPFFYY